MERVKKGERHERSERKKKRGGTGSEPPLPQFPLAFSSARFARAVLLSSRSPLTESLEQAREILWEHEPIGECFHSFFEFSQTFTCVSITR